MTWAIVFIALLSFTDCLALVDANRSSCPTSLAVAAPAPFCPRCDVAVNCVCYTL